MGSPPRAETIGKTNVSSAYVLLSTVDGDGASSQNGASCSAVTAPLLWRITDAANANRRSSRPALGLPSPNRYENIDSKNPISSGSR